MNRQFYIDKIKRDLEEHCKPHADEVVKALKLGVMDLERLKAISFLAAAMDIYANLYQEAKVLEKDTDKKV